MSCARCFNGSPQTGTPAGTYTTLHGYKTYIARPPNPHPSGSTILYLPDFFSHKLQNNQLLCDAYAQGTGCTVIFPDIVMWGGVDPSYMPAFETIFDEEKKGGWLAKIWAGLSLLPLAPQLVFGMPDRAFPEVLAFARAVRKDLPMGAKLGVAGFCWGGFGAAHLCKNVREDGERLIDAHFSGHPSKLTTPKDILDAVGSGVPFAVAVAEIDFVSTSLKTTLIVIYRRSNGCQTRILADYTCADV